VPLALARWGVRSRGLESVAELNTEFPTGLTWVEAQGGLRATGPADSPGAGGRTRRGHAAAIDEVPTPRVAPLEREMSRSGVWSHATYSVLRPMPGAQSASQGAKLDIQVILEPTDRSTDQGSRLIALVYLLIGLYVLLRFSCRCCRRFFRDGQSAAETSRSSKTSEC